ncbi:cilia- and flagella-associated protein 221-like [Amphiura filiformis]|uniref:cilia- and flagella-associated protein 221-like n=1 Tax=Amphiura filiformis TaxID=82378 RepID=UPI003B225FBD
MAVAKPLIHSDSDGIGRSNGLRTNGIVLQEALVAPHRSRPVPNHLLDTRIFHKLSLNAVVQVEPQEVHFCGFEPGKVQKKTLRLINISSECQQMHIIPPSTSYFNVWYNKKERLVLGLALEVTVEFKPDEWRYYYDCIRVHCQDEDNLVIPVHAYPSMNTSDFPDVVTFPPVPVSQRRTRVIPLRCKAPVDFDFQLSFAQHHPAYTVTPMSGVIPAYGQVDITVTFAPMEFNTAIMKLQLTISQFNSTPLICTFVGSSTPGLAQAEVHAREEDSSVNESQLDPHCISPVSVARRKKRTKTRQRTSSREAAVKELERDGVRFPSNLDTQHNVNTVLMQQAGKLKAKDLRDAVLSNDAIHNTRQLKEALFDHEVKQDVQAERRNQLRWQVHLGRDQISSNARHEILEARREAVKEYHFQRGDPLAEIEFNRACTACSQRRTHRSKSSTPAAQARFDTYSNDPWGLRHRAMGQFQQATMKLIIRSRADKKIKKLRKLVKDYREGRAGRDQLGTYGENQESRYKDLPLDISADKVLPYAFPTYTAPDFQDDMALDALGIVPSKPQEVFVKRQVPLFNLKVPQQYKLMSYSLQNVQDASGGYVPPKLIRPLRTGAEDEMINMPLPEPAWSKTADENNKEQIDAADTAESLQTRDTTLLEPPATLFKPIEYPSLHIFNPAPGLQVFMPPMPYAETDPDFHLCPLPRYSHRDSNKNSVGLISKKFLDREDVIRGVMQWKKFPSQGLISLANTPTLTNVWVPRWTDPFNAALLPCDFPPLLDGLPEEDKQNVAAVNSDDEEEEETNKLAEAADSLALTPDMVNAEFHRIEDSHTQVDDEESDEFPHGSKLPTHNNSVSATGPVPREKREQELEVFLKKRYNRLGEKVQAHVTHMNNLTSLQDLQLK